MPLILNTKQVTHISESKNNQTHVLVLGVNQMVSKHP